MPEIVETAEDFQPEAERVIDDLETLRVIADPLRIQILQVALEQPRTVKQMAALLKVPVAKLYYHVNTLEEHGLLRVTGTRVVSGIIEKQYRVTVTRLRFDRTLLTRSSPARDEALHLMLETVLETTREDIETISREAADGVIDLSDDAPPERKLYVVKTISRLAPERAAAFYERLAELVREFGDEEAMTGAQGKYSLTILMHPLGHSLSTAEADESPPD